MDWGDNMKYPCLVPKNLCKTEIKLELEKEGRNRYGEPFAPVQYEGKCNYQDSATRVLTDQKDLVQITGKALFPGDICPDLPVISSGKAEIFEEKRLVVKGTKARNPDGTVNFTEVMLR